MLCLCRPHKSCLYWLLGLLLATLLGGLLVLYGGWADPCHSSPCVQDALCVSRLGVRSHRCLCPCQGAGSVGDVGATVLGAGEGGDAQGSVATSRVAAGGEAVDIVATPTVDGGAVGGVATVARMVEMHPCDSSPCKHAGTCKVVRGVFACICVNGFHGHFCEGLGW